MVSNQAYLFLIFSINGVLIGLLFDFFRIARKVFHTNDMVTYLQDILFWILAGSMMLYSIFVFNNGEIRLFMFLGILLGAVFYMVFISSYIIKINVKIINMLKKIFGILIIPLKAAYRILHKIFLKPITFLFINFRKNFTNFGIKIVKNIKMPKKPEEYCKKLKIKEGYFKNM